MSDTTYLQLIFDLGTAFSFDAFAARDCCGHSPAKTGLSLLPPHVFRFNSGNASFDHMFLGPQQRSLVPVYADVLRLVPVQWAGKQVWELIQQEHDGTERSTAAVNRRGAWGCEYGLGSLCSTWAVAT